MSKTRLDGYSNNAFQAFQEQFEAEVNENMPYLLS